MTNPSGHSPEGGHTKQHTRRMVSGRTQPLRWACSSHLGKRAQKRSSSGCTSHAPAGAGSAAVAASSLLIVVWCECGGGAAGRRRADEREKLNVCINVKCCEELAGVQLMWMGADGRARDGRARERRPQNTLSLSV
jgi:hypothetical protein